MADIDIIPFHAAAKAFVHDSWLKSYVASCYCEGTDLASLLARDINTPKISLAIKTLMDSADIRLAVPKGQSFVYVGWAAVRGSTLDYVYVKKDARRLGIANELLNSYVGKLRFGCTTWPWVKDWAERYGETKGE